MKRLLYLLLTFTALSVAVPRPASAHPGSPHSHGHREDKAPQIDWTALPADIQAVKSKLDQVRSEQKGLFLQMRSQNEQIKNARDSLTDEQRKKLKTPAKQLIQQMRASRDDIRDARERKRATWDSFRANAEKKRWPAAKSDLETILKQKQEIVAKQQSIVRLQKQLLELISPAKRT